MPTIRDFAERCRRELGTLGLQLANHAEIRAGRDLAARTVGPNIASFETLVRVQELTSSSSFTFKGPDGRLSGVLAVIPLTPLAAPELQAGIFDGIEPPERLIARPGEPVIAFYGWGMAGSTLRGRAAVMAAAIALHREIFPTIPLYGRAATPGGERALLKRIGASPVPGPGGLVVAAPGAGVRTAA